MKIFLVLFLSALCSHVANATSVGSAAFVANDLRTSATPTLLTFGADVSGSGALAEDDTITVTSTGVFTAQATDFTVTIVSGSGNPATCTAEGTTTANALTVYLASAAGKTCAIANSATFSMTIAANIAANSATAGNVAFTMATSVDTDATASATGYTLAEKKLSSASFLANDLRTSATPTLITFGADATTALAEDDNIMVISTGVFTAQATDFTVTIVSGSGNPATCTAEGTTTANSLTVSLASASGKTCAIAAGATFSMTIASDIAANSATAGNVAFRMVTSKDNTATASATGYTLKMFAADPTFSPASGNVTTGSALTLTSTNATTICLRSGTTAPTCYANGTCGMGSTAYNAAAKPTITAAITWKAIGCAGTGKIDSAVVTAAYDATAATTTAAPASGASQAAWSSMLTVFAIAMAAFSTL